MSSSHATRTAVPIPARGGQVPNLTGVGPDGLKISSRDFYMRRNLAIMFTGSGPNAAAWVREASQIHGRAHQEAGEILVVAPDGVDTGSFPAIVDNDGALAARFGLTEADLPALFISDRYGKLFAASVGEHSVADLRPSEIPGWLEFVACRCT